MPPYTSILSQNCLLSIARMTLFDTPSVLAMSSTWRVVGLWDQGGGGETPV